MTPKTSRALQSAPGIQGLDEITNGGLPKGRPTLVCGAAGCGKTVLAMEFLVIGERSHYGEPGVVHGVRGERRRNSPQTSPRSVTT